MQNTKIINYRNLDFQITILSSDNGQELKADSTYDPDKRKKPENKHLHTKWDIKKFQEPHLPVEVGKLREKDKNLFEDDSKPLRVLDMPIKLKGSNQYKIPKEILPFMMVIQLIINEEHSVLSDDELLNYYAYLTIDQKILEKGESQRNQGAHVDGFQGSRVSETLINHSYVVSNGTPTRFYNQTFNFSKLDKRIHNFFAAMDGQKSQDKAFDTEPYSVYRMTAYDVHETTKAKQRGFRTFFRVSYDPKEFDRLGNTKNPLLEYNWNMLPREVQGGIIRYIELEKEDSDLIENKQLEGINQRLEFLKNNDLDYFYNVCYECVRSNDLSCITKVVSVLTKIQTMSTLRLLLIIASHNNEDVAWLGREALVNNMQSSLNNNSIKKI